MYWILTAGVVAFSGALLVIHGFAKSNEAARGMLDEYQKLLSDALEEKEGPKEDASADSRNE